jgi:hypothetical protein
LQRTAKSCGPGAPTLALSLRDDPQDDGGKKARSPGRSRISRNTIAQGRPDDPLSPVVLPRAFLLHADHGCGGHPVFPIGVKIVRPSIDIAVFVKARGDTDRVPVCGGVGSGWLVEG